MKLITAILLPPAAETVRDALSRFGLRGMTVSEVFADIFPHTPVTVHRARYWQAPVRPSVRLEIVAADADADDVLHVMVRALEAAGQDAQIRVSPVDYLIRVRTGEWGLAAL